MKFFERVEANWDDFKNEARVKWGQLKDTDWDDIEQEVEGRWRRFTEKVDTYYHESAEEVRQEAEEVMSDLDDEMVGGLDDDYTDAEVGS